jgi:hypothetical protein
MNGNRIDGGRNRADYRRIFHCQGEDAEKTG